MKYILPAMIFVCGLTTSFSQQTQITIKFSKGNPVVYFENYFTTNFKSQLSNLGIEGRLFVSFKINSIGKINSIKISADAHPELEKFVSAMLQTTNGMWQVQENTINSGNYDQEMILPIYYSLQKEGKTKIDSATLAFKIKPITKETIAQHYSSLFNTQAAGNKENDFILMSELVYASPYVRKLNPGKRKKRTIIT